MYVVSGVRSFRVRPIPVAVPSGTRSQHAPAWLAISLLRRARPTFARQAQQRFGALTTEPSAYRAWTWVPSGNGPAQRQRLCSGTHLSHSPAMNQLGIASAHTYQTTVAALAAAWPSALVNGKTCAPDFTSTQPASAEC